MLFYHGMVSDNFVVQWWHNLLSSVLFSYIIDYIMLFFLPLFKDVTLYSILDAVCGWNLVAPVRFNIRMS
jgi:hypothetical protein